MDNDEIKAKSYVDQQAITGTQNAMEWVILTRSRDGEISGFIRRDPDNHGRVQMFTAQTASFDEVLPLITGGTF